VGTLRKHYAFVLWTVTALTIVYLILLPSSADMMLYIGWADLEALQGHFPSNLFDLWLSRGIGYRLFIYLAEGLSRMIAGDALRVRFYIFNMIYIALGLALIASAYVAFLLRRDNATFASLSLRDRAETLALSALFFLPAVIWSWAQDTHISVLLCVLGIGLVLSQSVRAQWGSGVVLILQFTVKGVTALDFLFVLAIVVATGDLHRIRRVIISAAVATVAIALAYATILRTEFEDILLAAQLRPGYSRGLRAFISEGVQFALHNPAIPVALLMLALAVRPAAGLWTKNRRLVSLAIVIWLVPLAALFIQHEFWGYHYQGFVLSSWLCLAALYLAHGGKWIDFFRIRSAPSMTKTLVTLFCCVDLLAMGISFLGFSRDDYWYSFVPAERLLDCSIQTGREARSLILTADPDLEEGGNVLNLTSGLLNSALGLRSASRFFYPLPLWSWRRVPTGLGRDYVRSILTYEGPAIIATTGLSDVLPQELAPMILQHLRADYQPTRIRTWCADIEIWMRAKS
jgi:hypothetical protein